MIAELKLWVEMLLIPSSFLSTLIHFNFKYIPVLFSLPGHKRPEGAHCPDVCEPPVETLEAFTWLNQSEEVVQALDQQIQFS